MKQLLLPAFAATLFFTSCSNEAAQVNATATDSATKTEIGNSAEDKEERNKKAALGSVAGINAHDVDAVVKDAAPDMIDYYDGSGPPMKGVDSIKIGLGHFLASIPDIKGENIEAFADGNTVIVTGDWSGTFKKDMMGIKATNRSFKIRDADVFTFNDEGKITSHRGIQSGIVWMTQVGAKMPK